MKGQAKINGKDIWTTYSANLIKGTYKALLQGITTKDVVKNTSRLENGDRVVIEQITQKIKSREISISFLLQGRTYEELQTNIKNIIQELLNGVISFEVKTLSTRYLLIFKELSDITEYRKQCFSVLKIKFYEPNPNNREII